MIRAFLRKNQQKLTESRKHVWTTNIFAAFWNQFCSLCIGRILFPPEYIRLAGGLTAMFSSSLLSWYDAKAREIDKYWHSTERGRWVSAVAFLDQAMWCYQMNCWKKEPKHFAKMPEGFVCNTGGPHLTRVLITQFLIKSSFQKWLEKFL